MSVNHRSPTQSSLNHQAPTPKSKVPKRSLNFSTSSPSKASKPEKGCSACNNSPVLESSATAKQSLTARTSSGHKKSLATEAIAVAAPPAALRVPWLCQIPFRFRAILSRVSAFDVIPTELTDMIVSHLDPIDYISFKKCNRRLWNAIVINFKELRCEDAVLVFPSLINDRRMSEQDRHDLQKAKWRAEMVINTTAEVESIVVGGIEWLERFAWSMDLHHTLTEAQWARITYDLAVILLNCYVAALRDHKTPNTIPAILTQGGTQFAEKISSMYVPAVHRTEWNTRFGAVLADRTCDAVIRYMVNEERLYGRIGWRYQLRMHAGIVEMVAERLLESETV